MNKKQLLAAAFLAAFPAAASAITPLWLRDVQISPDGKSIAFCYKGDIWTVPTAGGTAVRLMATPNYEANPIWSPDSKRIAFASDKNGNFDVFTVPVTGGVPTRLTFDSASEIPESFTPDGSQVYFSAAIQDPAKSALFPSGRMSEVYAVDASGKSGARQVLATPAQKISWGSDKSKGGWFLYQDVKGFEDTWRKHHTSSVTRDIWRYDAATGKHTNLTKRPGEDLDPVVGGNDVYFLSERNGGTMNVYRAPLSDMSKAEALTKFKTHPVRFLSRAANGTLCFTYDGEIYTLTPGGKPTKVKIDLTDDVPNDTQRLQVRNGAKGAVPSPDGKSVAFTYRGDVYVTSVEYGTTKRITDTPEAEYGVCWAPDGKTLYFSSERDGKVNIYSATKGHESDPNFENATTIVVKPVFADNKVERSYPDVSPDGKQLAYIADRNQLWVRDLKSGATRQLTDGSLFPSRSGGFEYRWSPDSKWIVLEIMDRRHDPYSDVALLEVATGKVTNLTNTGYFAQGGKFVMDGNAILYASDRLGMRNHASWGSQMDLFLVFLNRDAYDRFRLSEEDYALRKEVEKSAKKADDKKVDAKKGDKKADDKKSDAKKEDSKSIVVELDGIADRTVRLTPMSTDLADAAIDADGQNLYYIAATPNGNKLWKMNLRKDDHKIVAPVSGSGIIPSADGKMMLITGSQLSKLDPKSDRISGISYNSTFNLDPAKEREYMFDFMAREEGARFYKKDMHGINWPEMTAHYRRFLPHISNNYDFAEMLSEILGELNVSHTGGRYSHPGSSNSDQTASLGLLFDMGYADKGLKIDEVVTGGPFDHDGLNARPGMIVTAINGEEINKDSDVSGMLNVIAGKKTLISLRDPQTGKTYEDVIIPITRSKFNSLLYNRWVKARAADVDRWSNGRLGYVHIESMGDPSFRTLYSDVLGKYNDRDGIVIDVRWNGGGRLHEDIEVMFSGDKYLTQEIRGVDACDMPSRRWNKPSIMLMSEACYSNAHGTPWVYKHKGLGKLVGAPVPGTMTSVNWVTLQDPTMLFGIPVIGYRTAEGTYLENSQLEPDVEVYNDPATIVTGEDTQLRTAVQELLKEIDAKKKK